MNRVNIQHVPFHPILPNKTKQAAMPKTNGQSFASVLEQLSNEQTLKVSKHANERMQLRDITITDQEWALINEKVSEAKAKGVNQPLVLLDQAALVVSAKNKTVITALDRNEAKHQLFTNIDGTIVI